MHPNRKPLKFMHTYTMQLTFTLMIQTPTKVKDKVTDGHLACHTVQQRIWSSCNKHSKDKIE